MKLLLVHNRYQRAGGEDAVFEFESSLLQGAGHEIQRLVVSNDEIRTLYDRFQTSWSLPRNPRGYSLLADAIIRNRPDIIHIHNTFPLLSSSVYEAANAADIPVVQTLHNYRISCAQGALLRNDAPCELCITKSPYNAVRFRCYRNSYLGSLAVARMIAFQRRHKQLLKGVARFVVLSEFARTRVILAGLPADRITVKPNGAVDSHFRCSGNGKAVLFVGRLHKEKGVRTLINAASFIADPVRIVGDGPLEKELAAAAPPNVTFVGSLSHDKVLEEMAKARCLVLPSACYENFPLTLAEAYSVGLPVIASRIGSLIELIEDGVTGFHFEPNDVMGLVRAVERLAKDGDLAGRLGQASRQRYEEQFTPARILSDLETIYHSVLAEHSEIVNANFHVASATNAH